MFNALFCSVLNSIISFVHEVLFLLYLPGVADNDKWTVSLVLNVDGEIDKYASSVGLEDSYNKAEKCFN